MKIQNMMIFGESEISITSISMFVEVRRQVEGMWDETERAHHLHVILGHDDILCSQAGGFHGQRWSP